MTEVSRWDLAVIGAGAAGLSVTSVAARLGLKVALIERGRMGGDCLNAGCVPSKALLAAAHAAQAARDAGRFGIRLPEPGVDWDAVREHVHGVIDTIAPDDSAERYESLGAIVFRGEARFAGPETLAIGGVRLRARRIVIAAGSRPAVPPVPGLETVDYLTNETLFGLAEKPAHLLILGGGPMGIEMADAFRGLGCEVTVVEAAAIAGRDEPELVEALRGIFVARGIRLIEGAGVRRVEPGPVLVLTDGRRIGGSHLLVAAGRRPNLEGLATEAGNVQTSQAGVVTDRGLRSPTNPRVFAVGDIADPRGIGPRAFTHVGSYHAGVVIRRAVFRLPASIDYAAMPRVIYTSPELAHAGLTEAEARAQEQRVSAICWPLQHNDRARAERDPAGLAKLVLARGRLVGAAILAPNAGEMIGAWALAIARRVPARSLAGLVLPYPTRNEAAKQALQSLYARGLFSDRTKAVVRLLARLP